MIKTFEKLAEYENYVADGLDSGTLYYVKEDGSTHFFTNNIDGTAKIYSGGDTEPVKDYIKLIEGDIESIKIPNGTTKIGKEKFKSLSSLKEVEIPNTVTRINEDAFNSCYNLETINIPNSVIKIEKYAFDSCTKLPNQDSVYYAGDCAVYVNYNVPQQLTIKDGTRLIGDRVFYGKSIKSITLPNTVEYIGYETFYSMSSLEQINIPDSVKTIDYGAFSYSRKLVNITIPDSVTSIGESAFSNCSGLTSVTINCANISKNCFLNCSILTSATISNKVTTIGQSAFQGCSGLTSVTIPNSVTSIGDWAFFNCSGLTSVTVEATTPPTLGTNNVFNKNASGRKIYVPAESVDTYKAASGWSTYAADIEAIPTE